MKTWTAFATAAALLAGISAANAQGSVNGKDPLVTGPVGTNAAFCSHVKGATTECRVATMAECRKDAGPGASCTPNPKKDGTTGSSSKMK
jgi:hypothetical protein